MAGNGGAKRGGNSGSGGGAATRTSHAEEIRSAESIEDISEILKNNYGFEKVDVEGLKKADFDIMRESCYEIASVLDEFPQAKGLLEDLVTENHTKKTSEYAWASLSGEVMCVNLGWFAHSKKLNSQYQDDLKENYHPQGTLPHHILSHETGHILETALCRKYLKESGAASVFEARDERIYANKVMKEVRKNLKIPGLHASMELGKVSKYSLENNSEALAECVADYRANGSKANPISKEVWKILKRELG